MARLLDALLALWILFVGAAYYGAYFAPSLWLSISDLGLKIYGVVLVLAVITLCLRWLRRSEMAKD